MLNNKQRQCNQQPPTLTRGPKSSSCSIKMCGETYKYKIVSYIPHSVNIRLMTLTPPTLHRSADSLGEPVIKKRKLRGSRCGAAWSGIVSWWSLLRKSQLGSIKAFPDLHLKWQALEFLRRSVRFVFLLLRGENHQVRHAMWDESN